MMARLCAALAVLLAACGGPELPLPDWHANGGPVRWETGYSPGRCASQIRGGIVVITIDPDAWAEMAPVERWFCIRHELAHGRDPDATELEADAFAAGWLVRSDLLSDRWEAELIAAAQEWPSSPDHPGGIVRAGAIFLVILQARAAVALRDLSEDMRR